MTQQRGPHHSKKCPFHILPNQPLSAKKSIARCVNCVSCNDQRLQGMRAEWDFSVAWEYAHKIMNPDGTEFKDVSTHGTNTVKKGKAIYAGGGRGASVAKGKYYLDTYTSIDINYATGRAGHSKKIKFAKVSIVTGVTNVE